MGIINVTPDSFSDGGDFIDSQDAIAHAWNLIEQGADILDIGGESTRPGAQPVPPEEEIRRVVPVIEGLKDCGKIISIDTRHAQTMRAAVEAGAGMINDVTALTGEGSLAVAAEYDVPVCLMHMQGQPQVMQENPIYDDAVEDIYAYLQQRIEVCVQACIEKSRIVVDPGIGFGKTLDHNLEIIAKLDRFNDLGVPVLLGVSRKSFIEKLCPATPADERLPGSLAAALWGFQKKAAIFRVHDVAQTKQAFTVYQAIEAKL